MTLLLKNEIFISVVRLFLSQFLRTVLNQIFFQSFQLAAQNNPMLAASADGTMTGGGSMGSK